MKFNQNSFPCSLSFAYLPFFARLWVINEWEYANKTCTFCSSEPTVLFSYSNFISNLGLMKPAMVTKILSILSDNPQLLHLCWGYLPLCQTQNKNALYVCYFNQSTKLHKRKTTTISPTLFPALSLTFSSVLVSEYCQNQAFKTQMSSLKNHETDLRNLRSWKLACFLSGM